MCESGMNGEAKACWLRAMLWYKVGEMASAATCGGERGEYRRAKKQNREQGTGPLLVALNQGLPRRLAGLGPGLWGLGRQQQGKARWHCLPGPRATFEKGESAAACQGHLYPRKQPSVVPHGRPRAVVLAPCVC